MKRVFLSTLFCLLLLPASLSWARGPIMLGVSDTGLSQDYLSYTESIKRPVPLLQTFHSWGTSLNRASRRWKELSVRPILHISLNNENGGGAIMSPKDVSLGLGDDYLIGLNQELALFSKMVYVRPIGEPNRPLNAYSAYLPNGQSRGSEYSPYYYRQAFRRISIVLRGGGVSQVNRQLLRYSLPLLPAGASLAQPKIKIFFSPLPSSLGIRGNAPGRFAPGKNFYDGVGTSFFSAWPDPAPLNRFYRKFSPGKMFYLLEWGLNTGRPRFVDQVYRWCQGKRRCRGMIFYQGFADTNYRLSNYPRAKARVIRLSRDKKLYPLTP